MKLNRKLFYDTPFNLQVPVRILFAFGSVLSFWENGKLKCGHLARSGNIVIGNYNISLSASDWIGFRPGKHSGNIIRGILPKTPIKINVAGYELQFNKHIAFGIEGEIEKAYPVEGSFIKIRENRIVFDGKSYIKTIGDDYGLQIFLSKPIRINLRGRTIFSKEMFVLDKQFNTCILSQAAKYKILGGYIDLPQASEIWIKRNGLISRAYTTDDTKSKDIKIICKYRSNKYHASSITLFNDSRSVMELSLLKNTNLKINDYTYTFSGNSPLLTFYYNGVVSSGYLKKAGQIYFDEDGNRVNKSMHFHLMQNKDGQGPFILRKWQSEIKAHKKKIINATLSVDELKSFSDLCNILKKMPMPTVKMLVAKEPLLEPLLSMYRKMVLKTVK